MNLFKINPRQEEISVGQVIVCAMAGFCNPILALLFLCVFHDSRGRAAALSGLISVIMFVGACVYCTIKLSESASCTHAHGHEKAKAAITETYNESTNESASESEKNK
ncbi:hypothetical protein IJT10_06245 [bacterium]|nr:hypothetical protein [bacterium]